MARVMAQRLDRDYPAVGVLVRRGARPGPLGADLQGAPLHGRRRVRHRPVPGDLRRVPRAGLAAARRGPGGTARAVRPRARRARGRGHGPAPAARRPRDSAARSPTPRPRCRQAARRAAGNGENGRGAVAGSRVISDRPDRPPAPLHLGPGIARRREDDQARARRHRERRRPRGHQQRIPRPAARPRRRASAAYGSVARSRSRFEDRARRASTTTGCRRSWPTCPCTSPTR